VKAPLAATPQRLVPEMKSGRGNFERRNGRSRTSPLAGYNEEADEHANHGTDLQTRTERIRLASANTLSLNFPDPADLHF
jgi:hypothetical protein